MLCCHFRALPLEDVPGFYQLPFAIGIVPPELAQSHFQPTLSLLESTIHIGGSFCVCPEHSGINKKRYPSPRLNVVDKILSEKSLRPRKAPVLYGVILQAIVLKCTISNTWLVRLTRRSRVFRLV